MATCNFPTNNSLQSYILKSLCLSRRKPFDGGNKKTTFNKRCSPFLTTPENQAGTRFKEAESVANINIKRRRFVSLSFPFQKVIFLFLFYLRAEFKTVPLVNNTCHDIFQNFFSMILLGLNMVQICDDHRLLLGDNQRNKSIYNLTLLYRRK